MASTRIIHQSESESESENTLHNVKQSDKQIKACVLHKEDNIFNVALLSDFIKEPIFIYVIVAIIIGSSCLLSGLFLLCLVSRTLKDDVTEIILLISIGCFIAALAIVAWKLTTKKKLVNLLMHLQKDCV